ncbi:MAG: hypothetical protein IT374_03945 [Polyangiaceae bacterium]|nr:hypothetical protein [Polyangiaceae bacterium]
MTSDDDQVLRSIRRRFGPFERFCLGAAAVVGTLSLAASVQGARRDTERGEQLVARAEALGGDLEARHTSFVPRVAAAARALAASEAPDLSSPAALSALQGGGVYLRLIAPRATDEAEVLRASRESAKDALASCLSLGVRDAEATPSSCAPDSACMGDATARLVNLRILLAGLAPFQEGWAARTRGATGLDLVARASEVDVAASGALSRARRAVDDASFVLLVVDDVPPGASLRGETGLAAIQTTPHDVKVEVLDGRSFAPLFRATLRADATPAASPGRSPAVLRQVQGCSLGLAVAERVRGA